MNDHLVSLPDLWEHHDTKYYEQVQPQVLNIWLIFSQQKNEKFPKKGGNGSRPISQRSRDTLRKVSSLLFIATPATVKKIDKGRLTELDSSTLVDLIKDYMNENQELRKENQDLYSVRDLMLRDQEIVCKENERLIKKMEDLNM